MDANLIYSKHWTKMSKLITTISNAIKDYYKTSGDSQLPDHELVLMSMQLFSLICGKKWGYSKVKLDDIWALSQDVHKLIGVMDSDVKVKGKLQEYMLDKSKQHTN